jgi:predicted outer membrane lipoprotein
VTAHDAVGRQQAGPAPRGGEFAGDLVASRDDGPLASRIGRAVQGQLPPLLPAVAGVTVTAVLAALGMRNLPGVLLLTPAVAMLLAALGAGHPHDGRVDWLVPPLLQAGQYVYLAAVGFALGVPPAATFALIAVIALHHMDLLHRHRYGIPPGPRVTAAGLGWEGRMLVAGAGGLLGIETFAYVALAGYLCVLFGWDSLTRWLAVKDGTDPR